MSIVRYERFDKDGIELVINTQTGESFATAKGYSRMSGQEYDTIKKRCQRGGQLKAEIPTGQGLRWGTLVDEDTMVDWLEKDNPALLKKFSKLGIRVSLHKLAGYEVSTTAITIPQFHIPQTMSEALRLAADLADANEKLSVKIEQDAPLVSFAETIQASDDVIGFNEFAKSIGTGRTRLFRLMRKIGVIMQNTTLPYQRWLDAGYFEVSQEVTPDGKLTPFALITGKGQIWLKQKIDAYQGDEQQTTELFNPGNLSF